MAYKDETELNWYDLLEFNSINENFTISATAHKQAQVHYLEEWTPGDQSSFQHRILNIYNPQNT